ncbi:MAG: hypothetical protein K5896_08165 [Prevotella sp.]|nr:hypothetical protein [Prevotella sp.]
MTKRLFVWMLTAAVMLAMGSCKDGKSHKSTDKDEPETELGGAGEGDQPDNGWDVTEQLERADYKFDTKLVTDDEGTAEKIIVTMTNTVFGMSTESEVEAVPLDTNTWTGFGNIREDDINFDGYPDLMVCLGPFNSYGNFTYAAWLWNQDMHDFVPVKGFDELFDPEFNKEDKTISSSFRMDDHEDDAVYKWNGDELEMVSSETIVYSELNDE